MKEACKVSKKFFWISQITSFSHNFFMIIERDVLVPHEISSLSRKSSVIIFVFQKSS